MFDSDPLFALTFFNVGVCSIPLVNPDFVNKKLNSGLIMSHRNIWEQRRALPVRLWENFVYLQLPLFKYYLPRIRAEYNVISLNSNRFLAILSVILGMSGLLLYALNLKDIGIILGIIFITFLMTTILTFFMTRLDPTGFAKALSAGNISTGDLVRFTSFESYRIVKYINRKKNEEIIEAIQKTHNSMLIVKNLKSALAIRLNITRREVSDDFLKFVISIYIDRQLKRAYEKSDRAKSPRISNITFNAEATEKHLKSLKDTELDLDLFSIMFKTRTIAGGTIYFIGFLETEAFKFKCHDDLKLLLNIQKSHRTGAAVHRALGLAIVAYIKEKIDKDTLKNRVNCLTEEGGKCFESTQTESFCGWLYEAENLINDSRRYASQHFLEKIKRVSFTGAVYIVVTRFSKAVRTVIKDVISQYQFKQFYVVVSFEDDSSNNFSPRLMYHQIVNEHDSNLEEENFYGFENRAWRSSPEALMSRFDKGDHLIFLSGCDHFDMCGEKESVSHVAYLREPMSILGKYRKYISEGKQNDIHVFIIGCMYKYDLHILVEKIEDKDFRGYLAKCIPKRRRSGLYRWEENHNDGIYINLIDGKNNTP
jgi:hypothetical protein